MEQQSLRRIRARNFIYDTVHKSSVYLIMAISVASFGLLSFKFYDYMCNVRPLKMEEALLYQEDLLKEGRSPDLRSETAQLRA